MFAEEYNYYQAGVLPSQFYSALTGKDISSFKDILWKMAIIIVSLCIVSCWLLPSNQSFCASQVAIHLLATGCILTTPLMTSYKCKIILYLESKIVIYSHHAMCGSINSTIIFHSVKLAVPSGCMWQMVVPNSVCVLQSVPLSEKLVVENH